MYSRRSLLSTWSHECRAAAFKSAFSLPRHGPVRSVTAPRSFSRFFTRSLPLHDVRPTGPSRRRTPSVFQKQVRRFYSPNADYAYYISQVRKNMVVIWAVLAANTVVFVTWQVCMPKRSDRIMSTPSGWQRVDTPKARTIMFDTLNQYFLLRVSDWKNGNYLSALGSAFSHTNLMHFLGNAISLYAFASTLAHIPRLRAGHLTTLIIGSALCGSAGFVMHESQQSSGAFRREKAALGASGVVMGLGAAAFILVPSTRFAIYGIVPVPLWMLVPGYFFFDAYYLDSPGSQVAHAGHLGGAVFGLTYALLRLRSRAVSGLFRR